MTEVFRRQVGDEVTYLAHLDHPPRKLKATWTVEAEQDLQAWHGLRAEFSQLLLDDLRREMGLDSTHDLHNWKQEGF